ncbi:MAG: helix-turn-helix domain-containing protein [Candidatus Hodarchaeales archaeon]|jgi:predicted transcriptional regulator
MVIITDLIHPSRIRILKILKVKPSSLTTITKKLAISKPEVSRHLARMRDAGLVAKEDKDHRISNLGEIIVDNLASLEFIIEKHEFFKDHQIIDLPQIVTRHLDSLTESDLISGAGYILKKMEEINQISAEELKFMVDQPFPKAREKHVKKSSFIIPISAKDENIDLEAIKDVSSSFEIRTLPVINVCFGLFDDKYGVIFFPDLKGKIDYNSGFFISDPLGMEFLMSLWDYFYKKSQIRVKSEKL